MSSFPTMIPPPAAWNAPMLGEFLSTSLWTPAIITVVVLELAFLAFCCGVLWYFGPARTLRVRLPKRRMRITRRTASLREAPSRPRAA